MQIDLRHASPDLIEADIAIVGAGAAGITMARRLVAGGRRVILLESGGLDYESDTAALNAGFNVGEPYYELENARLRFFGGTTAIWGGRSAELDAIDFEKRSWVPHSGWPFGLEEIKPWYAAAWKLLEVDSSSQRVCENGLAAAPWEELVVRHWSFDRKFDRFGYEANRDLVANPSLTLVLHATVREIALAGSGGEVESLDVRGPGGKRLKVQAKTYVLAAGGLENPRLLLASNSVSPNGLGNDHDLVGRFFMEHPHARGGRIIGAPVWRLLRSFRRRRVDGVEYAPLLTPSAELQRRSKLLNSAVSLAARPPADGSHTLIRRAYLHARHKIDPTRAGRGLWKSHRRISRAAKQFVGPISPWLKLRRGRMEMALVVRAEQSPNPDSRVTLDRSVDAIGMPRIRLNWQLQDLDVKTVSEVVDALGRDAAKMGLGQVEKAEWLNGNATKWISDRQVSAHHIGGYHHMGTTRMSDDLKSGVTDQWGRVHGIANLYVAGSSLFPTAGWANPTLTILALALRTSEHLLEGSDR